jgi:renalase
MRTPARRLLTATTGAAASLLAAAAASITTRPQPLPPHHAAFLPLALRMMSTTAAPPPTKRVAIIGAGIGGLTCARTLLELAPPSSSLQVTLWEKSTSHGRCATREAAGGLLSFDHGAPGFAVTTPSFRQQVDAWVAAGVVEPFPPSAGGPRGYYCRGNPTMRALPLHLAQGLDIRRPVLIERVARDSPGESSWALFPQVGPPMMDAADAVVVAVPPEQSASLLEGLGEGAEALHAAIAGVKSDPCITVMLAVPATGPPGVGGERGEEQEQIVFFPSDADPVLAKAARRRAGGHDCWVAHTTRAFTEQYVYTSAEAFERQAVVEAVLAAMRRVGLLAPVAVPVHTDAQRWLYSQTSSAVAALSCGWNSQLGLGLCGDGWAGQEGLEGVERAWLSGRALGEAMARHWWG